MNRTLSFFGTLLVLGAATIFFVIAQSSVTPAAAGTAQAQYSTAADISITLGSGGRVCCKRGWRDWWSTVRECRRAGGYRVANRECRDDHADRRICCKRGRHDWWATFRECRRAGGYQVANRQCRND